jgi:hypothetical protein
MPSQRAFSILFLDKHEIMLDHVYANTEIAVSKCPLGHSQGNMLKELSWYAVLHPILDHYSLSNAHFATNS